MLSQGNCYYFSKFQQSWLDATAVCQEVGAQLVVIKSDKKQVNLFGSPVLVWDIHLTTGQLGRRQLVRQDFQDDLLLGPLGKREER